jgi:hypothetical protein
MRIISFAWGGISSKSLYEENERLRAQIAKMDLDHARATRDLVSHFLDSLGGDEEALRYGLSSGLADLNDHVARLEEHSAS